MERTDILELMSTLKLYGMRAAYDEVMTTGIKRRHEPPRIVGDLLSAEIAEKARGGRMNRRWAFLGSNAASITIAAIRINLFHIVSSSHLLRHAPALVQEVAPTGICGTLRALSAHGLRSCEWRTPRSKSRARL